MGKSIAITLPGRVSLKDLKSLMSACKNLVCIYKNDTHIYCTQVPGDMYYYKSAESFSRKLLPSIKPSKVQIIRSPYTQNFLKSHIDPKMPLKDQIIYSQGKFTDFSKILANDVKSISKVQSENLSYTYFRDGQRHYIIHAKNHLYHNYQKHYYFYSPAEYAKYFYLQKQPRKCCVSEPEFRICAVDDIKSTGANNKNTVLVIDGYTPEKSFSMAELETLPSGNPEGCDNSVIIISNHHLFKCMGTPKISRANANVLRNKFHIFKMDENLNGAGTEQDEAALYIDDDDGISDYIGRISIG